MTKQNDISIRFVIFLFWCYPITCMAQATFQNLDFESANLAPIPVGQSGGEVPFSTAIPAWIGLLGVSQEAQALQNNYTLGAASIDIFGPQWQGSNPGIIDGDYTIMLQAGLAMGPVDASIAQTGQIPANAALLQFRAWEIYGGNSFSVSFAGNSLSPVVLSSGESPSGQQYNVYGVNIAPYAGQTGQLEFTSVFNATDPSLLLDDITFSTTAVPEPGTLTLFVLGGLALAARLRRAKCP